MASTVVNNQSNSNVAVVDDFNDASTVGDSVMAGSTIRHHTVNQMTNATNA